jgi:spore germination cell wall hydrolase CwlJ-like protein
MKNLWMIVIIILTVLCASALAALTAKAKSSTISCPVGSNPHETLMMQQRYEDALTIAMTIVGEARGEGEAGMYAVACVIAKRAGNRKLTLTQVCLQNSLVKGRRIHQFSCWNYTSLVQQGRNKAKLRHLVFNTTQGVYARRLAASLSHDVSNIKTSYVKEADHYCTLKTHNYWTKGQIPVAVIGNHKFFKLRP